MKDLESQGLPTAGRTSGKDPGIGLTDDPEMFLHKRDKLLNDGISIRATIRRIDSVGIIIVGAWMLEGDTDHPGTFLRDPKFIKFIPAHRPSIFDLRFFCGETVRCS
jgi:hypothetical protein